MAVVSDQAETVGVTAIPTPITDIGSELWFVHQLMYNNISFGDATGFQSGNVAQYEVDSKAMRKVNGGQDVVLVGELSAAASDGFSFFAGGRMLIKVN